MKGECNQLITCKQKKKTNHTPTTLEFYSAARRHDQGPFHYRMQLLPKGSSHSFCHPAHLAVKSFGKGKMPLPQIEKKRQGGSEESTEREECQQHQKPL